MREIGHQVNSLLKSGSRYSTACKHFTGEKSLSHFVQNKNKFIEPQEFIVGFDPDTEKATLFSTFPLSEYSNYYFSMNRFFVRSSNELLNTLKM